MTHKDYIMIHLFFQVNKVFTKKIKKESDDYNMKLVNIMTSLLVVIHEKKVN